MIVFVANIFFWVLGVNKKTARTALPSVDRRQWGRRAALWDY
jgi:hypothetical protein